MAKEINRILYHTIYTVRNNGSILLLSIIAVTLLLPAAFIGIGIGHYSRNSFYNTPNYSESTATTNQLIRFNHARNKSSYILCICPNFRRIFESNFNVALDCGSPITHEVRLYCDYMAYAMRDISRYNY